jgi:hypothetical protein
MYKIMRMTKRRPEISSPPNVLGSSEDGLTLELPPASRPPIKPARVLLGVVMVM